MKLAYLGNRVIPTPADPLEVSWKKRTYSGKRPDNCLTYCIYIYIYTDIFTGISFAICTLLHPDIHSDISSGVCSDLCTDIQIRDDIFGR